MCVMDDKMFKKRGKMVFSLSHLPKSLWREEVEQVEELFQVVLERSSRKQQFVLKGVIIQHSEKLQESQH